MGNSLAYTPHSVNKVLIGNASEAFMLRCQAQNLSDGTLTWYTDLLRVWNRFLEAKGVTMAKEVTPELIRLYLDDMRQRKLASGYVARTYGALRCFFGFLARERLIPHTLRHTFATQYVINGGDAFSLQDILGHSTLDMVKIYVALANRDIAMLHRRFSPMERMGVVPGNRRRIMIR